MNARLTTHTFEVLVATSAQVPQMLSSLISNQFIDGIIPSRLKLKITVAATTSVTIIDDLGGTTAATVEHVIELVVNKDSRIDYRVQAETINTAPVVKTITITLVAPGAQANVRCDCYGTENKTFSIKTLQDHQAPHTLSTVVIKSVLDGQASLNTHNTIRIHKAAQHANATQSNKNILLSKDAHVVTTPQLEIEAHDVKCKHGAAVSQLSPEHLFYLQARGLDTTISRNLLIQAFLT